MASRLTITLISESQEGNIGDDWRYELEAKAFSNGLKGQGQIRVPKHKLSSGQVMEPPHGNPPPLTIDTGEPGDPVKLRLKLAVAEVDLFQSDKGEFTREVRLINPAAAGTAVTEEVEVRCGVVEMPSQMQHAKFTLKMRLELVSDQGRQGRG